MALCPPGPGSAGAEAGGADGPGCGRHSQVFHSQHLAIPIHSPRIISGMSETSETPTRPAPVATAPTAPAKPYWLYRFAAWVVIVAGILFIVTTIFFAGFRIAGHGRYGYHHGRHCHHHAMVQPGAHRGPGGVPGSGFRGGAGGAGPSQPPQSVAPPLAPAHP